jgi:murein endopeptidase
MRRVLVGLRPSGLGLWIFLLIACSAHLPTSPHPSTAPNQASAPTPPPAQAHEPSETVPVRDQGYAAPGETIDDDVDESPPRQTGRQPTPHPLDDWPPEKLERAVIEDPASLGPMTIGSPNGGFLLNGVQMPPGDHYELVDPPHAWGTQETIDFLQTCIRKVNEVHPGSHPLYIGHISARRGGRLSPHVSHQSGRDVDVSYYYRGAARRWYRRAGPSNLDLARTWTFVRALLTETDVQLILIDASIQRLLRRHATKIGEDPAWLQSVFRGGPAGQRAIIRHARGHATHMHIRFYNPIAQETARRAYPHLVKHGVIEGVAQYVRHRVRKGETLGKLARRYGTSIKAIMRANRLRSSLIRAGRVYLIPKPTEAAPTLPPVVIPPRRLPPVRSQIPLANGVSD